MDGFAATQAIHEHLEATGGPMLPIVALTAHASVADRQACLDGGMEDFVSKPFTSSDLRAVLERWVEADDETRTRTPSQPVQARPGERPMPDPTSLDASPLEALRKLSESDLGFIERLIDTFLGSSGQLMGKLRAALADGNAKAAAEAAHPLKSSSAQLGLLGLSALVKDMEALGRSGSLEGAEDLLSRIEAEYEVGLEFLAAQRLGASDVI